MSNIDLFDFFKTFIDNEFFENESIQYARVKISNRAKLSMIKLEYNARRKKTKKK